MSELIKKNSLFLASIAIGIVSLLAMYWSIYK